MIVNENLEEVFNSLVDRDLGAAISTMEIYLSTRQRQTYRDRLFALSTDFQLMTDYWKRGYKDPQQAALYNNLLRRMYLLYADVARNFYIGNSSYLSSVFMRLTLSPREWSIQALREALEAHVSEMAMLELEPIHVRKEKMLEAHRKHYQVLCEWFDYLWLSSAWSDGLTAAIQEVLLSPTIESRDQELLVSAVMISGVNCFDINKLRTLMLVYQQSASETVRQRALVGWVLMLGSDILPALYADEVLKIHELLEDETLCQELIQLQQQIILCINAEKDNMTIQQEIMPDLMRGSNFRVTRHGVEEVEEDALADILHPDEEERRMEQMEESFRRMQDMQKKGADIYFGGFSQMKRFPFFREIANWLIPFYPEHPGIAEVAQRFQSNRFLNTLVSAGPFCNSDKYSFVLAFSQVVEHIPASVRTMLENGEASVAEVMQEEMQTTVYMRRTYLQDLYRFYRIFPNREEFQNPFSMDHCLFVANPIFSHTHLEPSFNDVAVFLMKYKRMEEAARVLNNCGEARRDFRYYMMAGYLAQNGYNPQDLQMPAAVDCYEKALELEPDNERALQGYARALFSERRYEEALSYYDILVAKQPEKKSYLLNRAVSLTNLSRYGEALKSLYKLNYESPDDMQVNRVLAWTQTCDGKYEQAIKLYSRLLTENPTSDDLLNYGYCLWFSGNVGDAVDCFHRYLKETNQTVQFILENEADLLREKGISEAERQMMHYTLI